MKFEWDNDKNIANHKKHKIWFEEAQTIWADMTSQEFYDPEHGTLEERFIRIGHSTGQKVLMVVFCERSNDTIIRIISARRATLKERRQYEEGI